MKPSKNTFIRSDLFFFILFIISILSSAQSNTNQGEQNQHEGILDKKISILYRNVSLEDILVDINKNYKINFSYINELVPLSGKIYIAAKEKPLRNTLDEMFKNTFIHYYLVGDQIVLVEERVIDSLGLNKTAGVINSVDSVKVFALNKKYRTGSKKRFETFKIANFFKGYSSLSLNNYGNEQRIKSYADSTMIDSIKVKGGGDSLKNISQRKYQKKETITPPPGMTPVKAKKYSLGIYLIPENSNWKMISNSIRPGFKSYNSYGTPEPGSTLGLSFNYLLEKRLLLNIGLHFTNIVKKGNHVDHLFNDFSGKTTLRSVDYASDYTYLGIPILFGYKLLQKKFGITFYTGFVLNRFLSKGGSNYYEVFDPKHFTNSDPTVNTNPNPFDKDYSYSTNGPPIVPVEISYRKGSLALYFNVQASYFFSKRIQLLMGPSLQIMRSVDKAGGPVRERPTLTGLKTELRYYF